MLGKGMNPRGFEITCCSLYTQYHFMNGEFMYMVRFWQGNVSYQAFVTDSSLNGRFVTVSLLKHILGLMSLFNKAVILNFNKLLLKYSVWSRKPKLTALGIRCADHATPSILYKVGTNFAGKLRSLSRYSSLAD
jgi:hypothetical protein